ncbi:hypothetical protein J3T65_05370 [Staphylococcus simiae]|uniref:hypothetical protein n=1 Tax=Staphylococcus simiae TaxID=308354 RepID=UPI001A95EEEC|nr:hypothetical protein [Staphylococcus simiae]MBO1199085.1 hypothetical protein [Staphylococcus simiae]MBO1201207.1 hypothetical protein [Staphylococcus simiae]MBO1203356.1 hypothetical protein [Staphylococcus simiae]MBO1210883.1 hypothetical protein [Staphylococcus simiae]MBO1229523.1 hypothetical protein [Staphylococcus simiae]
MIDLIKNKIKQNEKERKNMSVIHHENYLKAKKKIKNNNDNKKENYIQNHVEKELSRHF